MPDLYLPDYTHLRTKRRAFRIEIDNPEGPIGKKVSYHQEDALRSVDENNVETRISATTVPSLVPNFEDVMAATYEITDPVTNETHTFSGAAVALWIEADYVARATAALNQT